MDDLIYREDAMSQENAMNMSDERALKILKPMRYMMRDQHGCPISDAYFALERAIDALTTQQWIPCSERLPENDETVLVTRDNGIIEKATFEVGEVNNGWWMDFWYSEDNVKAWMPLPEPYKGEEK